MSETIEQEFFRLLKPDVDFGAAVLRVAERGYDFMPDVLTESAKSAMELEVSTLPLELGDHTASPLNAGTSTEIRQRHSRFYADIDDPRVPVARFISDSLAFRTESLVGRLPQLMGWRMNEAGYQLYRSGSDMIGVHRDRRNDKLLSVTLTIRGAAKVLIHETLDDPDDYKNTRVVDEYLADEGTVMMLRAPGLGSGQQVLHQVLPPEREDRLILNLRMRPFIDQKGAPKVLNNPSHE